jgi:serine/threonine protein kinase
MSAEAPTRLQVGSRIGADLTVLGTVDDGGTEPVYIVWHGRGWCAMACKVSRSAQHTRREAALLRRFAHPNIVRFLGAGEPSHILMEFLEGPTLLQLIRSGRHGRLPVADALRAAMHVGAALVHVDERGYLHLDVKPSNVIVARGRPVLFDFGSARRLGRGRPRSIIGTDEYMAPEQCRRAQLTPATDVFGLGATLYEMLTKVSSMRKSLPAVGSASGAGRVAACRSFKLSALVDAGIDRYLRQSTANEDTVYASVKASFTDGRSDLLVPYVSYTPSVDFSPTFHREDDTLHDFAAGLTSGIGVRAGRRIRYADAIDPGDVSLGLDLRAG